MNRRPWRHLAALLGIILATAALITGLAMLMWSMMDDLLAAMALLCLLATTIIQ